MGPQTPTYFATPAAFRTWLAKNAATAPELVVGFHKVGSGQPSLTWPESVDEALCVGWIDGVRKRIDEARYQIRFTPRKADSHWSKVNIARVAALSAEGRMQPAGLAAYERRTEARSGQASYERSEVLDFPPELEKQFRAQRKAWAWFGQQPPGYRRHLTWWVAEARQAATRQRRLDRLIEASAAGRRIE